MIKEILTVDVNNSNCYYTLYSETIVDELIDTGGVHLQSRDKIFYGENQDVFVLKKKHQIEFFIPSIGVTVKRVD